MLTSKSYYAIIKEKGLTPDVKYNRGDSQVTPKKRRSLRRELRIFLRFFIFLEIYIA
jgi:hypothetical protein